MESEQGGRLEQGNDVSSSLAAGGTERWPTAPTALSDRVGGSFGEQGERLRGATRELAGMSEGHLGNGRDEEKGRNPATQEPLLVAPGLSDAVVMKLLWPPLDEMLRLAVAANQAELKRARDLDAESSPQKRFRDPCWGFCRALRNHPDLAGLSGLEARELVNRAFARIEPGSEDSWIECGLDGEDSFGEVWASPFEIFPESFDRVKHPLRSPRSSLRVAMLLEERCPCQVKPNRAFGGRGFVRLVGTCYYLARLESPAPFFMTCEQAARIVESEAPSFGKRMLDRAEALKFISCVERGGRHRASRFMFNFGKLQISGLEVLPVWRPSELEVLLNETDIRLTYLD